MACKSTASAALFVAFNLLFFSFVTATYCPPTKKPTPAPKPKPTPTPSKGRACPIHTLKLGVCADLLGGLVVIKV
ncbi:hypothetical protein ACHQM5_001008 [Ranunculus cassubicifolius]